MFVITKRKYKKDNYTMKTMIKRFALTLMLSLGLVVPAAGVVSAQANIDGNLCAGSNLSVTGDTNCDDSSTGETIDGIIETIINIFSLVVGVIAVVMIIIGGLRYITSGGDSGNVTGAKNTILYAVVGLVIVALAQVIVQFVLSNV